jgi:hypothetical protein
MPSNYIGLTRHRRPWTISGRPCVLEVIDDEWACEPVLTDDDLYVARYEAASSNLLLLSDDDMVDGVGATTSLSAAAVNYNSTSNTNGIGSSAGVGGGGSGSMMTMMTASGDRRNIEDIWNDLGLDQLINSNDGETTFANHNHHLVMSTTTTSGTAQSGGTSSSTPNGTTGPNQSTSTAR